MSVDSTEQHGDSPDDTNVAARIIDEPWVVFRVVVVASLAYLSTRIVWSSFGRISNILLLLLVALFVSFALERPVAGLARRGWRRGAAAGAIMAGVLVVLGGFLAAMGALAVAQTRRLVDNADRYINAVADMAASLGIDIRAETIETWTDAVERAAGPAAVEASGTFAVAVASVGFVAFVSFYLIADGPKLRRVVCSLFPARHQRHLLATWEHAVTVTGGYLLARAVQGLIGTGVGLVTFNVLDLPHAIPLAIWLGIVSQAIPVVGTYLAAAVPLLVAFVHDPPAIIWVLVVIVAWRQLENYVIRPRLSKRYMDLHPAVGLTAVACATLLAGVVGTLLALPIAATVQAICANEIRRHDVVDDVKLDNESCNEAEPRTDPDGPTGPGS